MASWGRQLRRMNAFGRQLQRGADIFGRQVVNTSRDISRGLGSASRVVSRIERAVPDEIPVINAGLKTISSGLRAGQNTADLARVGGIALRNSAQGNVAGLVSNAREANALAGQLSKNVQGTLTNGASTAAQGATFFV